VPAADIPDIACPAPDCLQAPGEESIVDVYYQDVLGYDAPGDYNALNLEVNAAWDYEDRGDPIPALAEAMHARPDLRLFWAAGYFDLATTAYGGRFTLDQAGIPADRLTAAYFKSGHSVFVGEDNLEALSEAVRDFTAPSE
jgi:carboxypeptidase C (cathepsin A)